MAREPGELSAVNNKLLWWIMGIIGAILVASCGAWANSMYNAVGKVEVALTKQGEGLTGSLDNLAKELRTIQTQHLERIVRLEAATVAQQATNDQLRLQLTRMEAKMDEIRDRVR